MGRGYKSKYREYTRYFTFGFILAALAFGSLAIRLVRPDIPELVQYDTFNTGICEPSRIENCQPFYHPILRDCDMNVFYKLFGTWNATKEETSGCEQSNIYPECNPNRMLRDYIRECWKDGPHCPLDAEVETSGCEGLNIIPEYNPDKIPKGGYGIAGRKDHLVRYDTVDQRLYLKKEF